MEPSLIGWEWVAPPARRPRARISPQWSPALSAGNGIFIVVQILWLIMAAMEPSLIGWEWGPG
mgnify:CR=1 FL=1